jgi:hypothetical protein
MNDSGHDDTLKGYDKYISGKISIRVISRNAEFE